MTEGTAGAGLVKGGESCRTCEGDGGRDKDGEDEPFVRSPTFALPPKSLLRTLTEGMMGESR